MVEETSITWMEFPFECLGVPSLLFAVSRVVYWSSIVFPSFIGRSIVQQMDPLFAVARKLYLNFDFKRKMLSSVTPDLCEHGVFLVDWPEIDTSICNLTKRCMRWVSWLHLLNNNYLLNQQYYVLFYMHFLCFYRHFGLKLCGLQS